MLFNRSKILHGGRGRYDRSIIDLFNAFEIYIRYSHKGHNYPATLARIIDAIAHYYSYLGEPQDAEVLFLTVMEITRNLADAMPDVYSRQYASSCSTLAEFYKQKGRVQEAEEKYREELEIRKQIVQTGSEHDRFSYAYAIGDLIEFYSGNRELPDADETLLIYIHHLRQLVDKLPETFLPVVIALFDHLKHKISCFRQGRKLLQEILSIISRSEKLIEQYPEKYYAYAKSLRKLGWEYYRRDNYPNAEYVYLQSLSLSTSLEKISSGEYNREYGKILNDISFLYYRSGNLSDAQVYCSQGMKTWKKLLENDRKNGRHYARSLSIMAWIAQETGNYREAETCLLTEMKFWKDRLDLYPDTLPTAYARSLNDLAVFYHSQKRTEEAIPLIRGSIRNSLHLMNDECYPWESTLSERVENFYIFHTLGPGYLNKKQYHHLVVDFIEEISVSQPEQYLRIYANITAIFAHILFTDVRYNQSITLLSTIISKFHSDTSLLSDRERLILAKTYYNTGIVQRGNNQPEKAIKSFRKAKHQFSQLRDTDIASVKKLFEKARIQYRIAKSARKEKRIIKEKDSHIKHRDVRDYFNDNSQGTEIGTPSLHLAINRIPKKPGSSPTLIYDGGERAVIHRNKSMVVILNNFNADLIKQIKRVNEVTIRETDKKDHRVISKYSVPVKWVNNLVIPIWYEKEDNKEPGTREDELSKKTPLWHSDFQFLT